jgi:hypothetical protein
MQVEVLLGNGRKIINSTTTVAKWSLQTTAVDRRWLSGDHVVNSIDMKAKTALQ